MWNILYALWDIKIKAFQELSIAHWPAGLLAWGCQHFTREVSNRIVTSDGGSRLQTPRQVSRRSKWSPSQLCLPTSILQHDQSALPWRQWQGAASLHLKYLDPGQDDKRALIITSTQNEDPICAFGVSEVTIMLSVSFEQRIEELVYCVSSICRVKYNLYDAIMWPSIWLDRNSKCCFIDSLSSCLGKTQRNVIHMCLILIIHFSVWKRGSLLMKS